jgi:hypothetical protein
MRATNALAAFAASFNRPLYMGGREKNVAPEGLRRTGETKRKLDSK